MATLNGSPAFQTPDYSQSQGFQALLRQLDSMRGWDANRTQFDSGKLNEYANQFAGSFKNLTGRDPTPDEVGSFLQNAVQGQVTGPAGLGGTSYTDIQNLANAYIPNQFGADVQKNQLSGLDQYNQKIQDMINSNIASATKQFTDPNSPTYQAFSGQMNNLGISPSSGAFQAGLGGELAKGTLGLENSALTGFGIPSVGGAAGSAPGTQSLSNMYGGLGTLGTNYNNLYDFNLQSDLAKQLAGEGAPSGIMQDLGMAVGSAQGAGSLLQGGAQAKQATSYVCMELIDRGLCSQMDLDILHYKSFPALFKKARAFWVYAMKGKKIVEACNRANLDWSLFKKDLIDAPFREKDPIKVVEAYTLGCKKLCEYSDPTLWDEHTLRTSLFDSLPFIPLLFTYPPFLKAMWKVLKMKMAWFIDIPGFIS